MQIGPKFSSIYVVQEPNINHPSKQDSAPADAFILLGKTEKGLRLALTDKDRTDFFSFKKTNPSNDAYIAYTDNLRANSTYNA